ncbi:unnamed protein product [Rotaria sordida]|uniref:Uncharacterized protein n=1 Tax=Rotaria sordida TaxID=392033 RepID=A0A814JVA3_9BILA|nr:unnamed protein product [Rotaria sordida]CAF1043014.1 unnamed protein product [Rotaria sordida]
MFNIYFERPPTIVVCKHCGEDYDEDDYYTRKVTILQKNYRKQDAANRNQNSSLLINYNKNDYMIDVSYQSSDKLIETNNSYSQYQKLLEEQKRCKIRKSVVRIMCEYCEETFGVKEINDYQMNCTHNPQKSSYEAASADIYHRSPNS